MLFSNNFNNSNSISDLRNDDIKARVDYEASPGKRKRDLVDDFTLIGACETPKKWRGM